MSNPVRIVAFALGVAIVVVTVTSVFSTLVMPRVSSSRLLRAISRVLGRSAKLVMHRLKTYEAQDRIMAVVGPLGLVVLFVTWLALVVLGFSLMIWWTGGGPYVTALGASGSSIFTLGIVIGGAGASKALDIVEAGTGFGVIALAIAYLPTIYAAFSVREAEVTLLAGRGGTPAWGPEVLSRHVRFGLLDELSGLYASWERWAAAVSESHTGYPSLMWFRSPDPSRSWLVALVAVLDAAALHLSLAPQGAPTQARLCLRMGINCLRSLADVARIGYDPDPLPTAPLRLQREEFFEGVELLEAAHFPLECDREEAWRNFWGWRVNYEPIVDALTMVLLPPPAPWQPARPYVGAATFPLILNRTPDDPEASAGRVS